VQELSDNALLQEYVERDSGEAFAALVTRHVNKVYSIALRHTRNPHQAEEITQAVFVILAKKARDLSRAVILSGWLCRTARLTALTFLRSEIRRARREQEANMQNLPNETESELWPQIAPLLDAAMAGLSKADYHAIVLRFFDGKSLKEIGVVLGASEDTVRKRVNRAVEKLRLFFTKRGVVVPAAALTAAMAANSVQGAPIVLAKTATAVALTKGATASASTLALTKGALEIMALSKTKTAIVVALGVLLFGGTAGITVKEVSAYRGEVWQRKYDTSILNTITPQTKILPALRSHDPNLHAWGGGNGKWVGLGVGSIAIVQAAYDVSLGRMIFSVPMPEGSYDFISCRRDAPQEALQQAIKNRFGLVGRRVLIETNVLALTLRKRDAPGLQPSTDPADQNNNLGPDNIMCVYAPMSKLVEYLEDVLGTTVVDRTGLTGYFDIYVHWDGKPEGLKQVMLPQLGMELVPGRENVEFVVVEKAN
jgi:uncharacterized protein (TIGR03435 family)